MEDVQVDGSRALLIDGNNVIGAAADGWWSDPAAAVRRLVERLRCYVATTGEPVEVVLDVPQADLPEGSYDGVVVSYATRRGRDAADERILEILDATQATPMEVVTSDRALAEAARGRGALVTGAGRFLDRLRDARC